MSQEKYNDLNEPTQTPPTPSADTPLQKAPIDDEQHKQAASSAITTETKPESTSEAEGTSEAGDNTADNNDPPKPPKEPISSTYSWSPKKKPLLHLIFLIALIVIGVLLILYAWKLPPFTPTVQHTDNAFVKGRTTIISPQVSGYVTQVAVQDFAKVANSPLRPKNFCSNSLYFSLACIIF